MKKLLPLLTVAILSGTPVSTSSAKNALMLKHLGPDIWCETVSGCGNSSFIACGTSSEEIYNTAMAIIAIECPW